MRDGEFKELFQKHAPELAAFAFRMVHSREVAEEIVQSVFLSLWEQRRHLTQRDNSRAYLYTSVRRRALDVIKHESLAAKHHSAIGTAVDSDSSALPGHSAPARTPDEQLEHEEMVQALEAAIAELPERARQVALLRWHDGMSYDEIARVMEIAPKTVENQLRIAKGALREKLERFRGF